MALVLYFDSVTFMFKLRLTRNVLTATVYCFLKATYLFKVFAQIEVCYTRKLQ